MVLKSAYKNDYKSGNNELQFAFKKTPCHFI